MARYYGETSVAQINCTEKVRLTHLFCAQNYADTR